MPTWLFEGLKQFGLVGLLMGGIIYITIIIIKKLPEGKAEESEATKLFRQLTETLISHNERANAHYTMQVKMQTEFQERVQREHERMLADSAAIIQMLCVQNKSMDFYDKGIEEMKSSLKTICERMK